MQVVTLFNLMHVLSHSLNTMSENIFSNSLIFQEFAKLKYTLNPKISKFQNLTNAKISRPKVNCLQEPLKNLPFQPCRNVPKNLFSSINPCSTEHQMTTAISC